MSDKFGVAVNREDPPENWDCNDESYEDMREQTLQEVDFLRCIYDEEGGVYCDSSIKEGSGIENERDLTVEYDQDAAIDDSRRRVTSITAIISRKMSKVVIFKSAADRRAVLKAEEDIIQEQFNQRNCSNDKQHANKSKRNEACTMRPLGIPRSAEIVYHTKTLLSSTSTDVGTIDTVDYHHRLSDSSCSPEIPIGYIMDVPFLIKVRITIPVQYPISPITEFLIYDDGSNLTEEDKKELVGTMRLTAESLKGTGMGTLQSIIENVKGRLVEMKEEEAEYAIDMARQRVDSGIDGLNNDGDGDDNSVMEAAAKALFQQQKRNPNKFGRRCIFFHHIRNPAKRSCIQSLAKKLLLQGFCKIGWPGILVVEGPEDSCKIYVQVLQRMRWKLMVVRGEESFSTPIEYGIDYYRKVPAIMGGVSLQKTGDARGSDKEQSKGTNNHTSSGTAHSPDISAETPLAVGCIWETRCASEIAEWCKLCDLESLFKTSMKIYS
eukprot:Tbor_TRINITY_DN5544_c1_g1::TRINITY_DN5544_c1_g1_i1::g.13566::m.13566